MDTAVKRLYEGMFLVDSAEALADFEGTCELIKKILVRGGAQIQSLRKWDDRKLIYKVAGKDRGTYILVYFECEASMLKQIERDVQLSEQILRVLILRTDKISPEQIEKDTPATAIEKVQEQAQAAAKAKEAEAAAAAAAAEATEADDTAAGAETVEVTEADDTAAGAEMSDQPEQAEAPELPEVLEAPESEGAAPAEQDEKPEQADADQTEKAGE